jgi:hypothetical protein
VARVRRHGAEGVAGTRKGWSGRHGPDRSERPSREGVAGMDFLGRASQRRDRQAWFGAPRRGRDRHGRRGVARCCAIRSGWERHGRHGFVGTASPGQFWQARRGHAWKVRHGWLGEVGEAERGKVRLARCGRARARHGRQGLVGTFSLGMAGEVTRAWLGLELRALQASLGAEGQARLAGVERQAWNGWR